MRRVLTRLSRLFWSDGFILALIIVVLWQQQRRRKRKVSTKGKGFSLVSLLLFFTMNDRSVVDLHITTSTLTPGSSNLRHKKKNQECLELGGKNLFLVVKINIVLVKFVLKKTHVGGREHSPECCLRHRHDNNPVCFVLSFWHRCLCKWGIKGLQH